MQTISPVKTSSKVQPAMLNKLDAIEKEYRTLLKETQEKYIGDSYIVKSIKHSLANLDRLKEAILEDRTVYACKPIHNLQNVLSADGWHDLEVSADVRNWRRSLGKTPFSSIHDKNKKEVFNYFFKHDIYGNLNNPSTVHLSKGIYDPYFFRPPAIINASINRTNENCWFGYTDPLGHIEPREFIASWESSRRNNPQLSKDNIAIVSGATHGLNVVLSFLKKEYITRKNCLVITPTYAPIVDAINQYFNPTCISLDSNYSLDMKAVSLELAHKDSIGIVLSLPHNPYLNPIDNTIPQIINLCKQHNKYLIVDELAFEDGNSILNSSMDYKKLIIIYSYSKSYQIPGLKLAHVLASASFISSIYNYIGSSYGSAHTAPLLTASCLSVLESNRLKGTRLSLPEEIKRDFSSLELLQQEFNLWFKHKALFKEFSNFQVQDTFGFESNYRVFSSESSTNNIVIRTKLKEPSYLTMLRIAVSQNISVMPIECFFPTSNEILNDFRITLSIDPLILKRGLKALKNEFDSLIAREEQND